MESGFLRWDAAVFHFINGWAGHSRAFDALGIFFAHDLQYVLVVILAIIFFWPKEERARNRIMMMVGIVAAVFARYVVKAAILLVDERARPFMVFPDVHPLIATAASENFQSFPSGHAIFFFALSTVLFRYNKKLGGWFFAASAAIAITRVFVGVHWPSDVAGGALLGIIIGFLADKSYWTWKNRAVRT